MRKLLLLTTLVISLNCAAQTKKDTIPEQLTDTTRFLSIGSIESTLEGIEDQITGKQYKYFTLVWNYIKQVLINEWNERKKQQTIKSK